jgi:putative pyruvate formate lyase activating enzyme
MKCVFCQNFETSHEARGEPATPEEIAEMALDLQSRGCHNINFVSPTHHSPHLVEAVRIASDRGLDLPIVWNCGGYERTEILELLDGIVDIYMPDVKWSDDALAATYSKAPGYWANVQESLREMHRQVGDLEIDDAGLATGGLLVRHLVMLVVDVERRRVPGWTDLFGERDRPPGLLGTQLDRDDRSARPPNGRPAVTSDFERLGL